MNVTITKEELKEDRQWTDGLIKKFYSEPDERKYRSRGYAPLCLYEVANIEGVEKTEAFREAFEKARARSKAAQKAANRKRETLLDEVNSKRIRIKKMKREKLYERAVNAYNEYQMSIVFSEKHAALHCEQGFLDRLAVNYQSERKTPAFRRGDMSEKSLDFLNNIV